MQKKTKKYKKRKSKRRTKRKFQGGGPIPITKEQEIPLVSAPENPPVNEQENTQVSVQNNEPTLESNIEKIVGMFMLFTSKGISNYIDTLGADIGIDPNSSSKENIHELTKKLTTIVETLSSEEGEEFRKQAGILAGDIVEILKPAIGESEDMIIDSVEKLAKSSTKIAVSALNEIPIVFVVNEAATFITAALQAATVVANVTAKGANTIGELQKKQEEFSQLKQNISNLQNAQINTKIDGLNNQVNTKIDGLNNQVNTKMDGLNNQVNTKMNNSINKVGEKMNNSINKVGGKKYHEALMIGGRINSSITDFLTPLQF